MANTTTNWEILLAPGQNDHDSESYGAMKVAHAISDNGRVEVEMIRDDNDDGSSDFIISVYESYTYNYYPKNEHGEFIDHDVVANVRPSDNGTGWANSWSEGVELFMNALTSIERDNKWLSEPLMANKNRFLNAEMSTAAEQFSALLTDHGDDELSMIEVKSPPSDDDLDVVSELAIEHGYNDLAAIIGTRDEYDVESLYIQTFDDPI